MKNSEDSNQSEHIDDYIKKLDSISRESGDKNKINVLALPIEKIYPNPNQPRKHFSKEEMNDLVRSISEVGILQPIIVRPHKDSYEIVAGERRWRASKKLSLQNLPCIVRSVDSKNMLEIALIENIQRSNLNVIEEGAGYQELIQKLNYTQEQVARIVGKSRAHVANLLRIMTLPASVKKLVENGKLTAGHIRPLVGHRNAEELAQKIILKKASVREVEDWVRNKSPSLKTIKKGNQNDEVSEEIATLEKQTTRDLGLSTKIIFSKKMGSGEVRISYNSIAQLDDICRRLTARKKNLY